MEWCTTNAPKASLRLEGENEATVSRQLGIRRQRDLTWHELRAGADESDWETKTVDQGENEDRDSLAGASGWLQLFNALINPLLKAKQRVSGFVLWPCDYPAINKEWAGNTDEIPPPLLRSLAVQQSFWKQRWDAAGKPSARHVPRLYTSVSIRDELKNMQWAPAVNMDTQNKLQMTRFNSTFI